MTALQVYVGPYIKFDGTTKSPRKDMRCSNADCVNHERMSQNYDFCPKCGSPREVFTYHKEVEVNLRTLEDALGIEVDLFTTGGENGDTSRCAMPNVRVDGLFYKFMDGFGDTECKAHDMSNIKAADEIRKWKTSKRFSKAFEILDGNNVGYTTHFGVLTWWW